MEDTSTRSPDPAFRAVTAEEIRHYHENGWVHLRNFVPRDRVETILAFAKARMGADGTVDKAPGAFSYFNALPVQDLENPDFAPILRHFGANAVNLRNLRRPSGYRYFLDYFGVKLPRKEGEGHGKSDWHQDFAAQVADRSGGMIFWLALTDMTPEYGTMAFLNGSHRQGVMGDYRTYGDGNLLDVYPELIESCPSSGQLTLSAGDVTVHSDLCVHMAGPNTSGKPRWTYLAVMNPADARWTGAPAVSFDTTGLVHLGELDDTRFPRMA